MPAQNIVSCFEQHPLILTEGAVGQRIEREYGFSPDKDVMVAGLIYNRESRKCLAEIYREYLKTAEDYRLPILLMTNTRRANKERVRRSSFQDKNLVRDYAVFLKDLASEFKCEAFIGGMMGCKGNAYSGNEGLSFDDAIEFHSWQADMCENSPIDYMFAGIMPALPEAMGMAKVMEYTTKPYIISLMINKTGTLLDGTTIHEAITAIDQMTIQKPLCYMTNCVHPDKLKEALLKPFNKTETVKTRFYGIQANAANIEPEALDDSDELLTSSPEELAAAFKALNDVFPLRIAGGCCGTNNMHIEAIARILTKK